MAPFKKNLTPLKKGGKIDVHKGKGSQQAAMPSRGEIKSLAQGGGSINDYAKATPMAQGFGPKGSGGFGF